MIDAPLRTFEFGPELEYLCHAVKFYTSFLRSSSTLMCPSPQSSFEVSRLIGGGGVRHNCCRTACPLRSPEPPVNTKVGAEYGVDLVFGGLDSAGSRHHRKAQRQTWIERRQT